jgi:hypothetical protein
MKNIRNGFLLLLIITSGVLDLYAQALMDKRITLPEKNCTVKVALDAVRVQSGADVSHGANLLQDKQLTFDKPDVTVNLILARIKEVTGFTHKINGNKIILIPPSKSQSRKYSVSGYIRDAISGENLIGANIYTLPDLHGTESNAFGYYSISLPSDSVHLAASYVGYDTRPIRFFLRSDTVINIGLSSIMLDEIVIADEDPVEINRMSTLKVPVQQLKALPAMAGEIDIMKGLQLLPGVQAGAEGSSGLYVRGGSPDQNLILLDGVPVYNASHLFGFYSVFNADAINSVELIKGGFPARYGGRLSSVVNINMKEGNQQELHGEGAIGIIASKLTVEGPVKKNKSSFMLSGRRTFADIFVRPAMRMSSNGNEDQGYYFYDFSAKYNQHINEHNRLYLSFYSGNDKVNTYSATTTKKDTTEVSHKERYALSWGNITSAVRWNSILNPKLFSNLTATFSQYNMQTDEEIQHVVTTPNTRTDDHFRNIYKSGIRDFGLKEDIDFLQGGSHYIRAGAYGTFHTFNPGALTYKVGTADTTLGSYGIEAWEFGGYAEDDISISRRLKVNAGFHYSLFHVEGKNYAKLQPRLAMRFLVSDKVSIKASYVQMQQYIHMLSNVGVGLPTDLWVPATNIAKPEESWQSAVGFTYVPNKTYEVIIESYYKHMNGLIEYKNGASFLNLDKDWQKKIETGQGDSYGAEVFLKKKEGAWTGWLGYTLAWAYREFENIDEGKKFPFKYDRRHDLETALLYTWNKRIDFAFTWVYGSGYPTSLPMAAYMGYHGQESGDFGHHYALYYPSRNNFRMNDYHRLDVTISFFKKKKWGERKWIFGLYNAYGRRNPYYLRVVEDELQKKDSKVIQYSLFPVIPAISYSFKF